MEECKYCLEYGALESLAMHAAISTCRCMGSLLYRFHSPSFQTQTFEGTLVDKETFTTLGKFDIDGVFCSDRSIKRKLRESNERTRKCVPGIATERYFYSHPKRKSRKGVKESSGTIWTVRG